MGLIPCQDGHHGICVICVICLFSLRLQRTVDPSRVVLLFIHFSTGIGSNTPVPLVRLTKSSENECTVVYSTTLPCSTELCVLKLQVVICENTRLLSNHFPSTNQSQECLGECQTLLLHIMQAALLID